MLRETFTKTLKEYTQSTPGISNLWNEIKTCYTRPGRYYHTLAHLQHLLTELTNVKERTVEWNAMVLAIFYHDAIYNPMRSDNEEKSAALAEKRLSPLLPPAIVQVCTQLVLATKKHVHSDNEDTNHFTDADLSILGSKWPAYSTYAQNVRKEYKLYPDVLYNSGRKKVLAHFLSMPRIFKTDYFSQRYEAIARMNLQREREQY